MRKDSANTVGFILLLIALSIGGGYLLDLRHSPAWPWGKSADASPTLTTGQAKTMPDVPAGTSGGRTNTPIKCQDPEFGAYWTNAATCDQAGLGSRMSYSAPLTTNPSQDKYSGQDYVPPEQQAVNSRTDDNN